MARAALSYSLTETTQYRRLVDFAADVHELASDREDEELLAMVDDLRRGLATAST